jgi:predicted transposase/invertase (TIGR01784 family)
LRIHQVIFVPQFTIWNLLGSEKKRNLLIHFLNAILANELTAPITSVEILNPYNEKEFINDKLSIVDVKAHDERQHVYQIEIQLVNHAYLPERIVYNWADIHSQQLHSGDKYEELKPTYSIWLLAENLLKNDSDYVHCYKLRDQENRILTEQGGIWLLELAKFSANAIKSEDQRWLKFFKDGEELDDTALPDWMSTNEMRQAMTTLSVFSEKERAYFQYQARQEYLRVQAAIEQGREIALQKQREAEQQAQEAEQKAQEAEQKNQEAKQREMFALQEKEIAIQGKQQALLEIERLKALLASHS